MKDYKAKYPKEAAEFKALVSQQLPAGWESALPKFTLEDKVRLLFCAVPLLHQAAGAIVSS